MSMSHLAILALHTPAPPLEAALQFCSSEASTPVSPQVASTRKWSTLPGKVAGTADNHSVGAVTFSSQAAQTEGGQVEAQSVCACVCVCVFVCVCVCVCVVCVVCVVWG